VEISIVRIIIITIAGGSVVVLHTIPDITTIPHMVTGVIMIFSVVGCAWITITPEARAVVPTVTAVVIVIVMVTIIVEREQQFSLS